MHHRFILKFNYVSGALPAYVYGHYVRAWSLWVPECVRLSGFTDGCKLMCVLGITPGSPKKAVSTLNC